MPAKGNDLFSFVTNSKKEVMDIFCLILSIIVSTVLLVFSDESPMPVSRTVFP